MIGNFEKCFKLTVGHEGGYSKDKKDRGNWTGGRIGVGALKGTKFGISAAAYPTVDIKNLTIEQAADLYRKDYWYPIQGDKLPTGIDYLVFDAAVNHGVHAASEILQETIRTKVVDGLIGPKTLATLDQSKVHQYGREYMARRHQYWGGIQTFDTYGLGWSRRGVQVFENFLVMIGVADATA